MMCVVHVLCQMTLLLLQRNLETTLWGLFLSSGRVVLFAIDGCTITSKTFTTQTLFI